MVLFNQTKLYVMSTSTEKKMFENPVMEMLSISGPKIMIPFHLIVISLLIYRGTQTTAIENGYLSPILLFAGGFVFWTFAEYLLHRYVFHFIHDSPAVMKFHYAVHGYHHSVPRDHRRLFMPPLPAAILLPAFWGLFYLTMGDKAWFFLPGFELGYLGYAIIHYSTHTITANQAPALLRPLWIHHALHHYQYPDKAFGVSNRFWDRVFGTMPPANAQPRKRSAESVAAHHHHH